MREQLHSAHEGSNKIIMGNYTVTVINANFHARIKLGNLTMVNQVVKLKSYPNIPTMQCSFCCMGKQLASDFSSSEHAQKYGVCKYSQITPEVKRNRMNEKLNLMQHCILDACILPRWEDRNGELPLTMPWLCLL